MATASKGKSKEGHYATYKTSKRWETNRIARLERTVRNQPNNEQAKAALKAGLVYRRKTPKTRPWSASWIRVAKLFKEFTGSFNPAIMSSNPKVASEAMQVPGAKSLANAKTKVVKSTGDKGFFSIEARLQGTH